MKNNDEAISVTQKEQRNDFTKRLLKKYLHAGMNVLDVGCGNGEISFLAADVVGKTGSVVGVDLNQAAITAALAQKEADQRENTSFLVADINALTGHQYDVVFGRRVLMYQAEPLRTMQTLKKQLKPGGIMVFQESDEIGSLLNDSKKFPVHIMAQNWVWETVKREGGNTHIGSELYGLMKAAGMHVLDYCSEAVLQTLESGSDLAWVVKVMQARMEALGIPAETKGLEDRLNKEMQKADHAFIRDLAFGICAQNL